MPIDSALFVDAADLLDFNNAAILEKDYFVVDLLKLLAELSTDTHTLVFAGGTALAKSNIKTYRMSEDVDIKLIPTLNFHALTSKNARKKARKALCNQVLEAISSSEWFSLEGEKLIRDEYRYQNFNIRYPQKHSQPPCLRPFIKLELIETTLFDEFENRQISSFTAQAINEAPEIQSMACVSILSTQAEKLVSMLRRTASHNRDPQRDDDPALIRHIYDTYYIQKEGNLDIKALALMISEVIQADIDRYGNQHSQFVQNPIDELRYGLALLSASDLYEQRFIRYITPMVYGGDAIMWQEGLDAFSRLVGEVLGLTGDAI